MKRNDSTLLVDWGTYQEKMAGAIIQAIEKIEVPQEIKEHICQCLDQNIEEITFDVYEVTSDILEIFDNESNAVQGLLLKN